MSPWGSTYLAAQAAYLRLLATASCADVIEEDGLLAVRTRVFSNTENGVLSCSGAPVGRARASELAAWFAETGVPASWLCSECSAESGIGSALVEAGYRPESEAWEMSARLADVDLGGGAPPPGIRVERISGQEEHDAWLGVASACEWIETTSGRAALHELHDGLARGAGAAFCLYVAWQGSDAVGMASAFYGTDVLLTAVAVVPDARRRGIGRTLAIERLAEARRRGCELAVLAATPDGGELYETLGFTSHRTPPSRWFYAPLAAPPI